MYQLFTSKTRTLFQNLREHEYTIDVIIVINRFLPRGVPFSLILWINRNEQWLVSLISHCICHVHLFPYFWVRCKHLQEMTDLTQSLPLAIGLRVDWYLSYFSITIIAHHDQGNFEKKKFNCGLLFQRVRVHTCHVREHGQQAGRNGAGSGVESSHLETQPQRGDWSTSKPSPRDTPPPAKSPRLIFHKQF